MITGLNFAAVAVAALEGLHHSRNGEGQQEKPDDDGDLRSLLKNLDEISPPEMHHVEVAIEGQGDEEGDAGSPVKEQHEEHRLTLQIALAAPQVVLVMVGFGRETGHQQEVSNHNIEEEDTFVLPEFEPKGEVIRTVIINN